jgi:hypothetical protein
VVEGYSLIFSMIFKAGLSFKWGSYVFKILMFAMIKMRIARTKIPPKK